MSSMSMYYSFLMIQSCLQLKSFLSNVISMVVSSLKNKNKVKTRVKVDGLVS